MNTSPFLEVPGTLRYLRSPPPLISLRSSSSRSSFTVRLFSLGEFGVSFPMPESLYKLLSGGKLLLCLLFVGVINSWSYFNSIYFFFICLKSYLTYSLTHSGSNLLVSTMCGNLPSMFNWLYFSII